jgi:hypothetical protein
MERLQELPVGLKRLWAGVLIAPSAWVLAEGLGYYLASRSCEPRNGGVPLRGTAHPAVTQAALSIVLILAAAAGLLIAVGNWRGIQPQPSRGDATQWGRAHFMSFAGVLVSVLFIGGIVLFGIPSVLVDACRQAQ